MGRCTLGSKALLGRLQSGFVCFALGMAGSACSLVVDDLLVQSQDGSAPIRSADGGGSEGVDAMAVQDSGATDGKASSSDASGSGETEAAPGLSLTTVTASSPLAGASGVTLTITGTGLATGATVSLADKTYPTVGSGTVVSVGPLDLPEVAGNYEVVLRNPDKTTANAFLVVNNVVPTITEVRATSTELGAKNVSVTLTGVGFAPGMKISFAGTNCVGSCSVKVEGSTVTFGPVLLPSTGQVVPIDVRNPSPTLGSAMASLTVPWPALSVAGISLSSEGVGATGVTVKVGGTNLAPGASVTLPVGFSPAGAVTGVPNRTGTELLVTGVTLPPTPGLYALSVQNPSPTAGVPKTVLVSVLGEGTSCGVLASTDGVTNCGDGTESCCTSLAVPGGTFKRNYDGINFGDGYHRASVSDFRLDKYEVTVGRFRRFVEAWLSGWRPGAASGKHVHLNDGQGLFNASDGGYEAGWDITWVSQLRSDRATWDSALACNTSDSSWTGTVGSHETLPMNCVNWFEAQAFCMWDAGFLPSDAEWNYAASGGQEHREYPWGSGTDNSRVNYACGATGCIAPSLLAVGSRPEGKGKWLQLDLAGNVEEWARDTYGSPPASCSNCVTDNTNGTVARIRRGGANFHQEVEALRVAVRASTSPLVRQPDSGIRCARPPLTACSGHGNRSASGACACAPGWEGAECNVCAQGFVGPHCDNTDATTCRSRGKAQGDGTCICATGYSGEDCGLCASGWVDSNGTASGGACVALPTDGTTSIACDGGFTDSNGPAAGGTCVMVPTDGTQAISCDPGFVDTNNRLSGGTCVAMVTAPGTSCQTSGPGRSTCGAGSESCCTSLFVLGGTYFVGYNTVNLSDNTHQATVSDFRLDKYEVTVGRFREFVSAWNGNWRPSEGSGKHGYLHEGQGLAAVGGGYEAGWEAAWSNGVATTVPDWDAALRCNESYQTWTSIPGPYESRPINCMTWFEAYAFCIWDGGFLASEAEWNYAAAGGSEHRYYPWSDPADIAVVGSPFAVYAAEWYSTGSTAAVNVGSRPKGVGKWGHFDLAGNVWEWTLDRWTNPIPYALPEVCINCANVASNPERVARGGGIVSNEVFLRSASRNAIYSAGDRVFNIGVRCARPL